MRCTYCGHAVRETRRGGEDIVIGGRPVRFVGPYIHSCEHGQDGHQGHPPNPRVVPMTQPMARQAMRESAEKFNEEWDRAWAIHESGVDER